VSIDIDQIEDLKHQAKEAFELDRMASVVELLQCYLEYFPNDDKAWFDYGDALRILGRKTAAEQALMKAVEMCPPKYAWIVQSRVGMLYNDKGAWTTAERWFSKALESEEAQKESWLWVLRGINFAEQELFDEAEACYQSAIIADGKFDEAYTNLALIYRAQERYEDATAAATTALKICPEDPAAEEALESSEGAIDSRNLVKRLNK
jgi:tetratricopeptide (TPR) repeat protein